MADFFKGLTGGFQSGLQLGEAMRAKQEREALAAIMQEKPVAAGPDFAGQFRMQGLEQGPMPQAEPIQDTQSFMGQQYAQSALTPDKVAGLRYGAMADVIAQRDPAAALRMRQEQVRMQREAELAPLQKEALETQVKAGKLGLKKTALELTDAERVAAERENFSGFNAFAAENPNLSVKELKDTAFKQFKFTPKQWQDTVATRLQIETGEMDSFKNSVKKKLQGKNLTQLGSLYNSDPDFDDKTDLAIVPGKGGAVTLNFIDKATKTITGTQTFKNEALATEYLNRQATEPETIGSWIMNLRKGEADINAKEASTTKDRALGNLYNQGGAGAGKGGLKQRVAEFKEVYNREPNEAEKAVLAGLVAKDPNKPEKEFDPVKYTTTIKNLVETGLSPTAARIEADKLFGRGPSTASEDAGLQKANAAKGGAPATVTKPSVGLTPQQREQVNLAPQPTRAPTTLDAIQSANIEAVSPLAAQFKQARAQLIQASQSQDPNAIAYYMNQQNVLRNQLESEVSRRFGNNAQTVMQQLAGSM